MLPKRIYWRLLYLSLIPVVIFGLLLIFPVIAFTPLTFILYSIPAIIASSILLVLLWITFFQYLIYKKLNNQEIIRSVVFLVLVSLVMGPINISYFEIKSNNIRSSMLSSKVKVDLASFTSTPISPTEQKVDFVINTENFPDSNKHLVFEVKLLRDYNPPPNPAENYVTDTAIRVEKQENSWLVEESSYGNDVNKKNSYTLDVRPNSFPVTYTYNPQQLENSSVKPNMLEVKFSECDDYCTSFDNPIFYNIFTLK